MRELGTNHEFHYDILSAHSDEGHALKRAAALKYENTIERKLASLRSKAGPPDTEFVVWEVDKVNCDAPLTCYNSTPKAALDPADKEAIDIAYEDALERRRKRQVCNGGSTSRRGTQTG